MVSIVLLERKTRNGIQIKERTVEAKQKGPGTKELGRKVD